MTKMTTTAIRCGIVLSALLITFPTAIQAQGAAGDVTQWR